MGVAQNLIVLVALLVFCLGCTSLGRLFLRGIHFQLEEEDDQALVPTGVGLVFAEIILFLAQYGGHFLAASRVFAGLLLFLSVLEARRIAPKAWAILKEVPCWKPVDRLLFFLIFAVVCFEFLVSMGPLTGSDAMHYHFAVQKVILAEGFHPIFSNSHSFLCGQHHLLILFGLALGSEKLALALIFLGGVLTAAVLRRLVHQRAPGRVALAFALLFLVTPVVFWQISASGAPDIYMAFFAALVILVLSRRAETQPAQHAFVAGILTGGVVGAKYTGCVIAAAIAIAVWKEFPKISRLAIFVCGSLLGGIWPYLRNFLWTGDPVFPFFGGKIAPQLVSSYGLASLAADTGANVSHNPLQLLPFLFFAAGGVGSLGLWNFFGPTVFALAPLLFIERGRLSDKRNALLVWILAGVGIFFTSGLTRFLLPLFPLALFCVGVGVDNAVCRGNRFANAAVHGLVAIMILMGMGGLALFGMEPVSVALGLSDKEAYLRKKAQDYEICEAVNRIVGGAEKPGTALVFFRHLYYLNVPYVNGDPQNSFETNPDLLKTEEEWKAFLRDKHIAYVVRTANYPGAIARPLEEMESKGELAVKGTVTVGNLQGMRVNGVRTSIPVVVLRVNF